MEWGRSWLARTRGPTTGRASRSRAVRVTARRAGRLNDSAHAANRPPNALPDTRPAPPRPRRRSGVRPGPERAVPARRGIGVRPHPRPAAPSAPRSVRLVRRARARPPAPATRRPGTPVSPTRPAGAGWSSRADRVGWTSRGGRVGLTGWSWVGQAAGCPGRRGPVLGPGVDGSGRGPLRRGPGTVRGGSWPGPCRACRAGRGSGSGSPARGRGSRGARPTRSARAGSRPRRRRAPGRGR